MTWKNDFVYSRVDKVIIMYVCLLLTQLATINTDSINNQILYFTLTWRNWSKNYSWTLAMKYMEYRPLLLPICSMVTGGARWTFKTMPGHLCPAWDSWQQALSVCVWVTKQQFLWASCFSCTNSPLLGTVKPLTLHFILWGGVSFWGKA